MIALLLAFNWRSFDILNTTFGNDKNKLCEISNRIKWVRSANSSGNLFNWLFERFKSGFEKKKIKVKKRETKIQLNNWCNVDENVHFLPVIKLNFRANFGGIFLITFELKSHVFNSVFRIKWYTASGTWTNWHSERSDKWKQNWFNIKCWNCVEYAV